MKQKPNLSHLLNLDWCMLTNTTKAVGNLDLPMLSCHTEVMPAYLALYSEPGRYQEAGARTCVCFYEYDITFDGINGLFNAIYYNDKDLLDYFKRRFAGVRIFITPDYSQFGDVHRIENEYRLFKAGVVSLWLTNELHAVVIPNITGANTELLKEQLQSLIDCRVVAFSTKGHMHSLKERERLMQIIHITVDYLNLTHIVVYDVCGDNNQTLALFQYAINKGINIVIPPNTLKIQNRKRKEDA